MTYQRINNLFGWVAFLIAAITYILTLEPYGSFWDCGEFIACAYRLQVAHQPGAPLFTMIGKLFSLFAGNRRQVAYLINVSSALASAATIMFLFWTITAFAKKILVKTASGFNTATTTLIIGAGLVGALAYAWSDTFWFSAEEAEVYALSSLCTAIVFWAIMKWDAHADEPGADKWIIFIAYVMGLSIGIHLLNLLAIPAMACVYYFRRTPKATARGTIITFFVGIIIVAIVLWGIIQYLVKGAAYADLLFVNTFNFGFWSGATTFFNFDCDYNGGRHMVHHQTGKIHHFSCSNCFCVDVNHQRRNFWRYYRHCDPGIFRVRGENPRAARHAKYDPDVYCFYPLRIQFLRHADYPG